MLSDDMQSVVGMLALPRPNNKNNNNNNATTNNAGTVLDQPEFSIAVSGGSLLAGIGAYLGMGTCQRSTQQAMPTLLQSEGWLID